MECIFFKKGYLQMVYDLYRRVAKSSGIEYRDMIPWGKELLAKNQS